MRKTGKLKLTITLDERSDLTIKVSARKTKKAKLRTLTTTTRKGVAAGKPSYTLTLSSKVRKALKKGETLTIAVQARDAAGNVGTGKRHGQRSLSYRSCTTAVPTFALGRPSAMNGIIDGLRCCV